MSTAALSLASSANTPAHDGFARTLRIVLTEARFDLIRMMRTRTFSLTTIGFPVMFYLLFGVTLNHGASVGGIAVAKYMLGSYAVMGVVSAALFGIGVQLSGELAAGWVELKRASPMPPLAYLLAKCFTAVVFGVIVTCVLATLGVTAAHVSLTMRELRLMLEVSVLGSLPFAAMGLLIGVLAPANSAPGVTNVLYLPMSFAGGLLLPVSLMPKAVQHIAVFLPTYHLGQLMTGVLGYPVTGAWSTHIVGLLVFTCLMLGGAGIAFRRRDGNA